MKTFQACNSLSYIIVVAGVLFTLLPDSSRGQSLGVFESHADVGNVWTRGTLVYDPENQTYTMSGSGTNMWTDRDEFHFAWKRMTGDFILRTRATFVGNGVEPHRKIGWIIRAGLDTSAAYVDVALHGDGLMALQYRRTPGSETEHIVSALEGPDVLQLARHGGRYIMSVAHYGDPFEETEFSDIDLGDEVYVGLFVCAHNPDVVEKAVFQNVRVIVPAKDDFVPYRDYIGSRLETMDMDSGNRLILRETDEAMQAPNWAPDGKTLIYNSSGLLYRFELATRTPAVLNTDFVTRNNNDHVLTFDGQTLGISQFDPASGGASRIYTLPVAGGTPVLVTENGPSYLHGWSPDSRWLVFAGGREDNFDIYRIPAGGGQEVRLTTSDALDDGPEVTRDGKYVYFNSTRTGTMELWRMRPDGSAQEQLTDDVFNNWFPHISPDGKRLVFVSFRPEIAPEDHPWYKHVYIREMPVNGGSARVVAYVYGGQGTMNVPSWSPDGKQIAFVSNTSIPY